MNFMLETFFYINIHIDNQVHIRSIPIKVLLKEEFKGCGIEASCRFWIHRSGDEWDESAYPTTSYCFDYVGATSSSGNALDEAA
jgi:hypothetical protein